MKEARIDVEMCFREGDLASSLETASEYALSSQMTLLEANRERVEQFTVPLHSAKVSHRVVDPHVAVCFEMEGEVRLILYNCRENKLEYSNEYEILDFIRCDEHTPRASIAFSHVEHFANMAVQCWCAQSGANPSGAQKISTMYLQPQLEEAGIRKLLHTADAIQQ
jgi:hypothetical protein